MSDTAEEVLDRIFEHIGSLNPDKYSYASWKYANRPTGEGVGQSPKAVDVDTMVDCILNVEAYADNVRFVEGCEILQKDSDTEFTYIQRMSLPLLGKVQTVLHIADYGEMNGYRVVAWNQDDERTMALDKKNGFRTEYNLGGWLLKEDAVAYALSSCPVKKDVGSIKFAIMTKGADTTASQVVQQNIDAMVAWSERS